MTDRFDPSLQSATVQADSDALVWFQCVAVAHDLPVGVGDDAVASGQNGVRVEVVEARGDRVEMTLSCSEAALPGALQA